MKLAEATSTSRFLGRELVLGQAKEAAGGIRFAVGLLDDFEFGELLQRGEQAIVGEFEAHGTETDLQNLRYVLDGTACDAQDIPEHVQAQIRGGTYHGGELLEGEFDAGHEGMTLADFVSHPTSVLACLNRANVLALRLYTSSSYPQINHHLRTRTRPHPFKMTVYHLSEAVKKLRVVAAETAPDEFTKEMTLYRGMRNMSLETVAFFESGGTELAPMSTSRSREVAFSYAASECPLVFKYRTAGLGRGVSIEYLSLFPKEREYLYPPLTFLMPVPNGLQREEDGDHSYLVFNVMPQMS